MKESEKCELCGKRKGTKRVFANQDFKIVKGEKKLVWIDPIMICKECFDEQDIEYGELTEDDL